MLVIIYVVQQASWSSLKQLVIFRVRNIKSTSRGNKTIKRVIIYKNDNIRA